MTQRRWWHTEPGRCVIALIIAAAVIALLATGALPARAHESWINQGDYRAPKTSEHCCGDKDCFVVLEADVKITSEGYVLTSGEVIPFAEALRSEDQDYWRCQRYNGSRRCFFAPMKGF